MDFGTNGARYRDAMPRATLAEWVSVWCVMVRIVLETMDTIVH